MIENILKARYMREFLRKRGAWLAAFEAGAGNWHAFREAARKACGWAPNPRAGYNRTAQRARRNAPHGHPVRAVLLRETRRNARAAAVRERRPSSA